MPERSTFSKLQVCERVVIFVVEVCKKAGKSLIPKITERFFFKILSYKSARLLQKCPTRYKRSL